MQKPDNPVGVCVYTSPAAKLTESNIKKYIEFLQELLGEDLCIYTVAFKLDGDDNPTKIVCCFLTPDVLKELFAVNKLLNKSNKTADFVINANTTPKLRKLLHQYVFYNVFLKKTLWLIIFF